MRASRCWRSRATCSRSTWLRVSCDQDLPPRCASRMAGEPRRAVIRPRGRSRALIPARRCSSANRDRVEHLRRIAKSEDHLPPLHAQRSMRLLREGALREWDLLIRGSSAFWRSPADDAGIGDMVDVSRDRSRTRSATTKPADEPASAYPACSTATSGRPRLSRPPTWSVIGTSRARAQDGRAVRGHVVRIDQPQPNRHPCTIHLRTDQTVLRMRRVTGPSPGRRRMDRTRPRRDRRGRLRVPALSSDGDHRRARSGLPSVWRPPVVELVDAVR